MEAVLSVADAHALSYARLVDTKRPVIYTNPESGLRTIGLTFPDSEFVGLFSLPPPLPPGAGQVDLSDRAGWIFYVSIDREDLPKAFDAVRSVAVKRRPTLVLIRKPNVPNRFPVDEGREIVVVDYMNPKSFDRQTFLNDLIQAFVDLQVYPGRRVDKDTKTIKGAENFLHYHNNFEEVRAQRKVLEQQDPKRTEQENFRSPYMSSELDLDDSADLDLCLELVLAHQIFYEYDRRLPSSFGAYPTQNEEGKHLEFQGNVILAMKITEVALAEIRNKGGKEESE